MGCSKGCKALKIKSPKIQKTSKNQSHIAKNFIEDEKNALIDSLSDEYISNGYELDEDSSYYEWSLSRYYQEIKEEATGQYKALLTFME